MKKDGDRENNNNNNNNNNDKNNNDNDNNNNYNINNNINFNQSKTSHKCFNEILILPTSGLGLNETEKLKIEIARAITSAV